MAPIAYSDQRCEADGWRWFRYQCHRWERAKTLRW